MRRVNSRFVAGLAVFAWLALSTAHAAEPIFLPGLRIGLVPPAGMTASANGQGFEDPGRQALIAVSEFTAEVFSRLEKEFSVAQLRADGFEVQSHEPVVAHGARGFLVVARQTVARTPLRKWALVLAGEVTAVVIAVMPEGASEAYPDATMRQALATVTIRSRLSVDELMAALPYRIEDLSGFRLLRTNSSGVAVLTLGPDDTTQPSVQPYFTVMFQAADVTAVRDQDALARRMLAPFMDPGRFKLLRAQALRIGGQPGHEILGEMRDSESDVELAVVQWVRFGTSNHMQMLGVARIDQWSSVFPRMRAIRDGIAAK
jgi:hypothetical protein